MGALPHYTLDTSAKAWGANGSLQWQSHSLTRY